MMSEECCFQNAIVTCRQTLMIDPAWGGEFAESCKGLLLGQSLRCSVSSSTLSYLTLLKYTTTHKRISPRGEIYHSTGSTSSELVGMASRHRASRQANGKQASARRGRPFRRARPSCRRRRRRTGCCRRACWGRERRRSPWADRSCRCCCCCWASCRSC